VLGFAGVAKEGARMTRNRARAVIHHHPNTGEVDRSRILAKGSKGAFAIAIILALVFGPVQALSGAAGDHCPSGGGMAGTCESDLECLHKEG